MPRMKPPTAGGNDSLKSMILGALEAAGGDEYLKRQAKENPTAFMSLVGKVLPLTLVGNEDGPAFPNEIRITYVDAKDGKPV